MTATKQMVVDKLIDLAIKDGCFGDNRARVASARQHGTPLPESSKPGAILKKFKETASEEELAILETLKPEDWMHRIK